MSNIRLQLLVLKTVWTGSNIEHFIRVARDERSPRIRTSRRHVRQLEYQSRQQLPSETCSAHLHQPSPSHPGTPMSAHAMFDAGHFVGELEEDHISSGCGSHLLPTGTSDPDIVRLLHVNSPSGLTSYHSRAALCAGRGSSASHLPSSGKQYAGG